MSLPQTRPSPDSGHPLVPFTFHGVRLDVCRQTGGVWFDAGELLRIQQLSPSAVRDLEYEIPIDQSVPTVAPTARHCPNDGGLLDACYYVGHQDILLQACPRCHGVWIDHKALDAIAGLMEQTAPSATPPNLTPDARAALALFEAEHEEFMNRTHALTSFLQAMHHDRRRRRRFLEW